MVVISKQVKYLILLFALFFVHLNFVFRVILFFLMVIYFLFFQAELNCYFLNQKEMIDIIHLIHKINLWVNQEISISPNTAKVQDTIETEWKITSSGLECVTTQVDNAEHGTEPADFNQWLYRISKESFGNLSIQELLSQSEALNNVFATITYNADGHLYFSSHYNIAIVNANIRKAFYDKRILKVTDELTTAFLC